MTNTHLAFLKRIRNAGPADPIPTATVLTDHLSDRIAAVGRTALAEFVYLQKVAAGIWGPERAAHFAQVLRQARATSKAPRKTRWQRASEAVDRLPAAWRDAMARQVELSRKRSSNPGFTVWSADYILAVTSALCRWADYCGGSDVPIVPNGASLDLYGRWLSDPDIQEKPVSLRTVADYLTRVHAGLAVVEPGHASAARAFVTRCWQDSASAVGSTTKAGSQLVGAKAIYNLGFDLMGKARSWNPRGLHAARDYRNGLILAIGVALPQRARALSALDFGRTLHLPGGDAIHVRIPAQMLKRREDRKDGEPFDRLFHNERLAAALEEYRQTFRPLFDDGTWLFPSMIAPRQAISEGQIGCLTGNITKRTFGVRIPIHRLRDNVATDASEELSGGRLAARVLLDHADIATGDPYDHSEGLETVREYGDLRCP